LERRKNTAKKKMKKLKFVLIPFRKIRSLKISEWVLIFICVASLAVRLVGMSSFSPYLRCVDEEHYVEKAIDMLGHDKVHTYFSNPPFYTLILFYTYLTLCTTAAFLGNIPFDLTAFTTFANHHMALFLFCARLINSFLCIGAVVFTYKAMTEMNKPKPALFAAAMLAFLPLSTSYSAEATNNMLLIFCVSAYLWALLCFSNRPLPKYAIMAGIFMGCGITAKYNMALLILPAIWLLAKRPRESLRLLWFFILSTVLAALLTCPWLIHSPKLVLAGLKAVLAASGEPWIYQSTSAWRILLDTLYQNFGILGSAMLLTGFVVLIADKTAYRVIFILILAPFLFHVFSTTLFFSRFLFPILIPLCIICALGLDFLTNKIKRPRIFFFLAISLLIHPVSLSVKNMFLAKSPTMKDVVGDWCDVNLPGSVPILGDLDVLNTPSPTTLNYYYTWNLVEFPDSATIKKWEFRYFVLGSRILNGQIKNQTLTGTSWDHPQAGNWISRHISSPVKKFDTGGPVNSFWKRFVNVLFPGNAFFIKHTGSSAEVFEYHE
jgi:4-amino-4-deoxy-L-arabinose transferase-like glycosyltransferase